MRFRVFVKGHVGQRFHSGGNLQHTIESYHWPEQITNLTTVWAFETFWPPDTLQMASAGCLIREEFLKL